MPSSRSLVFLSGTNGLPGRYGGWDQLLSHLAQHLSKSYDVIVHTSLYDATPGITYHDGAKIDIIKLKANGPSSILYDFICMFRAFKSGGICVMLGTSGGLFFPLFRLLGLKIILNPDGEEWNRGKWSRLAKIYLFISDFVANIFANVVIADHPKIMRRVSKLRSRNLYCIPYGGDNALTVDFSRAELSLPSFIQPFNYVFGVCRIEPENNVHLCLEAMSVLNLPLVFVGNWQRSKYGQNLFAKYSSYPNILLLDPIYEPRALGLLRSNCHLYFHGHTVGGTNPSLVEALCLGLRVICHDNEFNRQTAYNNALFFANTAELIDIIMKNYDLTIPKSESHKDFFLDKYSWQSVVQSYASVIDNV